MSEKKTSSLSNEIKICKLMIGEISWKALTEYIANQKKLLEAYTRGGFKFVAKNRQRAEQIILKKCDRNKFQSLFLLWYSEQLRYKKILDEYFRSEKYRKWAKQKNIKDNEYALPNSEFEKLCSALEAKHPLYFLHFSPIKFDKKQAETLVFFTAYEIAPLKIAPLEEKRSSATSREEYNKIKDKYRDLKKNLEKLSSENSRLVSENKKLTKEKGISENRQKKDSEELKKCRTEAELKIEMAVTKVKEELEECKETMEVAVVEKESLVQRATKQKKTLEIRANRIINLEKKLKKYKDSEDVLFHKILNRIDPREFYSNLNEPDEIKEKLSSAVKPPTSSESAAESEDEVELKQLWLKMIEKETETLNNVTSIDAAAVVKGAYFQKWADHADDLIDLKHSLRARTVLINMLYDILRQNFGAYIPIKSSHT